MIWKIIPGWENFYEVSDSGDIRSVDRALRIRNPKGKIRSRRFHGRLLKVSRKTAYPFVRLSRPGESKDVYVHDLVMLAFFGRKPSGLEVCHNDGNPFNNSVKNLRYDTRSSNSLDRFKHGTVARQIGTENKTAKLTKEEITEIRNLKGLVSNRYLGRTFGVSHSTIGRIISGESYSED